MESLSIDRWSVSPTNPCEVQQQMGAAIATTAYANALGEDAKRRNARVIAQANDMYLLLEALRAGIVEFYAATGELRFDGLMYSTLSREWSGLCDAIGRERLLSAIRGKVAPR